MHHQLGLAAARVAAGTGRLRRRARAPPLDRRLVRVCGVAVAAAAAPAVAAARRRWGAHGARRGGRAASPVVPDKPSETGGAREATRWPTGAALPAQHSVARATLAPLRGGAACGPSRPRACSPRVCAPEKCTVAWCGGFDQCGSLDACILPDSGYNEEAAAFSSKARRMNSPCKYAPTLRGVATPACAWLRATDEFSADDHERAPV